MAITTAIAYKHSRDQARRYTITKGDLNTINGASNGVLGSLWTFGYQPVAGSAPGTASAPTKTTTGALNQSNSGGSPNRIWRARAMHLMLPTNSTDDHGMVMIVDRLSHQSGLVGNVGTSQTTNLPTAALTRYTSGQGVQLGYEVYTGIGSASDMSFSYTNESGTTGRTTPNSGTGTGGDSITATGDFMIAPFQSGDLGCRAVASATVNTTSVTAGDWGVTLFYPLVVIPFTKPQSRDSSEDIEDLHGIGWFPEVQDNACLSVVIFEYNGSAPQYLNIELWIGDETT